MHLNQKCNQGCSNDVIDGNLHLQTTLVELYLRLNFFVLAFTVETYVLPLTVIFLMKYDSK